MIRFFGIFRRRFKRVRSNYNLNRVFFIYPRTIVLGIPTNIKIAIAKKKEKEKNKKHPISRKRKFVSSTLARNSRKDPPSSTKELSRSKDPLDHLVKHDIVGTNRYQSSLEDTRARRSATLGQLRQG